LNVYRGEEKRGDSFPSPMGSKVMRKVFLFFNFAEGGDQKKIKIEGMDV
jgi:hypothetical protein